MIINGKYVDYTLASLLKEKGFDEEIETLITPENKVYFLDENSVTNLKHIKISNSNTNPYSDDVSCPDLWDVMKWLRKEHNLHCDIGYDDLDWFWNIISVSEDIPPDERPKLIKDGYAANKTYEEACENAIKYCLENLI